jgi:hypothetical protein
MTTSKAISRVNGKSDIEIFAKEQFGIELLPIQIEMIKNYASGKIVTYSRLSGLTTANKIIQEYIKQGISYEHPNLLQKKGQK